ncbi:MAG: VWA domain-containing protein [Planctomycetaceae bacterium]|nr:VWA domain-containing protein [Planctomycetaceae bacterium]
MRACKFHFAAQNAPTNPLDSARRGAMLVLIAALMSVFLIALVFTIDVAYMQLVRTQLRVAADASAKAGMEALTRTESVVVARQVMRDVLASNQVAGRALTVQDQDIQFGRTGANPDGSWQFLPNQQPYQAIRVSLGMTEGSGNESIPLIFGRILGQGSFTPTHQAVAANLIHEIVLCLDRSHSMCFDLSGEDWVYPPEIPVYPKGYITPPSPTGSRWRELDVAVEHFVRIIGERQIKPDIGMVTWGSDIRLGGNWRPHNGRSFPAVIVDVPLGQNLAQITPAIQTRYEDIMMGGTNMSAGIDRAVEILKADGTHSLAQKTIILMSDGQWNAGRDPISAASDAAARNVTIHVISFLAGQDLTMQRVAEITGGKFYNAPDGNALQEVFEELAKQLPVVLID